MKHRVLAAILALTAIACAPPPAQEAVTAGDRYVVVAHNRTQVPVEVHYKPGPGGGAPFIVDMVGPMQRKTLPMPDQRGAGGGTFSAQTLEGKPAGNVSITIERVKVPAARAGN